MKKFMLAALFAAGAALSAHAETPPNVIRFAEVGIAGQGKTSGIGLAPLADELGLFQKEFGPSGPKIQITYYIGTGPAINEVIAEGQADFGEYGALPVLIGLANGVPGHVFLAGHDSSTTTSYAFAVHPNAPYKTVSDLKGARIAVQKGTNPYMLLVQTLQAAHLTVNDVKLVNLQQPEALAAFNAGSVDALFSSPSLLILHDKGQVRLIFTPVDELERETSISGIVIADDFEKKYPETASRIAKVLVQTSYWASQDANREAVIKYFSNAGYGLSVTHELYSGSFKQRYNPVIDDNIRQGFAQIAQFAADNHLVRAKPDTSNWFLPQYGENAVNALNLQGYWVK